jgi:hypothetical protein
MLTKERVDKICWQPKPGDLVRFKQERTIRELLTNKLCWISKKEIVMFLYSEFKRTSKTFVFLRGSCKYKAITSRHQLTSSLFEKAERQ